MIPKEILKEVSKNVEEKILFLYGDYIYKEANEKDQGNKEASFDFQNDKELQNKLDMLIYGGVEDKNLIDLNK